MDRLRAKNLESNYSLVNESITPTDKSPSYSTEYLLMLTFLRPQQLSTKQFTFFSSSGLSGQTPLLKSSSDVILVARVASTPRRSGCLSSSRSSYRRSRRFDQLRITRTCTLSKFPLSSWLALVHHCRQLPFLSPFHHPIQNDDIQSTNELTHRSHIMLLSQHARIRGRDNDQTIYRNFRGNALEL